MTDADKIPTNLRTLRILEIVSGASQPMTPTEINANLGLPKQTVHRLCQTLLREGFLVREGAGKRLRPGRRLRSLAAGALHASRFHIARHQILLQVAEIVHETVNFVVPGDAGMTYRDRIETDWALRILLPVGTHVPFHCTASGKTFLASLPPPERDAMVTSLRLDRHTAMTHTEPGPLLAELKEIAEQGYALDNEEFFDSMVAIAVPVHDEKRRYVTSLAFHGPTQRLSLENAIARKNVLQDAAARLSASLHD